MTGYFGLGEVRVKKFSAVLEPPPPPEGTRNKKIYCYNT